MSTFDSDDLEATGYFMPVDSQFRLKRLRGYVGLLTKLARSRTADEEQERTAGIRAGEMAICLELLAEQVELVLGELSWPAERGERTTASRADVEPGIAEDVPDDAGSRYFFGVTLNQIDAFTRLIDIIAVHSTVVIASEDAEFADHTPSLLGDAIFKDAGALREIIHEVQSQRLGQVRGPQAGVGEERAVYDGRIRFQRFGRRARWRTGVRTAH